MTAAFIRNGLAHALACVPGAADAANAARAAPALWEYRVDVLAGSQCVEMALVCPATFTAAPGIAFQAGERLLMEVSRKYTAARVAALAARAGVGVAARWVSDTYAMQLLAPAGQA